MNASRYYPLRYWKVKKHPLEALAALYARPKPANPKGPPRAKP